jgi:tetratricopeptide (TPR) repeat protein
VLGSEDVDTVVAGMPAFVILLDGVLEGRPDEPGPWLAAAQLNSVLAGVISGEPERFRLLSRKALRYATEGLSRQDDELVGLDDCTFAELDARLATADPDDAPALFALAAAWSAVVRSAGDDIEAFADLARVEAILERVIALDETVGGGAAHLYLGAFKAMVSPEQGGDLEPSRRHFERLIEMSNGEDLTAKVALALHVLRPSGERDEAQRLLEEVAATDPVAPSRTLLNVMAQRRARAVLRGEEDPWSRF